MIKLVQKGVLPAVAAGDQMIKTAFNLDSEFPGNSTNMVA
jgi:hypothetical protein